MNRWRGSPQTLLIAIGLLLGMAVLPTIAGCTHGVTSPISRVIQAVGDRLHPLPAEAQVEYDRFAEVFAKYATDPEDAEERLAYFEFAFKRIRTSYVKSVDDKTLIDTAISGIEKKKPKPASLSPAELVETALDAMTASLDPHSGYLNAQEFNESFVHTKGEFGGLGIEVTMEDGLVKVVAPIEDTPAARAGMLSGDLIVKVDGGAIKGLTLAQAVRRMRGRPGAPIKLLVRRADVDDFEVTIVRAVIKVRAVRWQTFGRVGYVRVSRFSERVETGIVKAFASLRSELGGEPDGIVLDLRNNPGGLLDQSIVLADAFLEKGEVVSVRGRTPENRRSFKSTSGDIASGLPMIVLINGGSASASEIVASALKVHGRATVMGGKSFGKGSVQTIIPLPVEGALRLTTALYYGPDGNTIQARGVEPNIVIEMDDKPKGRKREADLPGAIPAAGAVAAAKQVARIPEKACPAADAPRRTGREPGKDRVLGCALAFIKAESREKFIAAYGSRQQM